MSDTSKLSHATDRVGRLARLPLLVVLLGSLVLASIAQAELPATPDLLADLGLSPAEISQVESGEIVHPDISPASDRELVVAMVFRLPVKPDELVARVRKDVFDRVDPTVTAFGLIGDSTGPEAFGSLALDESTAQGFAEAEAGDDVNLSKAEIAAFEGLGKGAKTDAVTARLRRMLADRLAAYRARGLDGIAPYARGGRDVRDPAEELRIASKATRALQRLAPAAHRVLLEYPAAQPDGMEESFRWSQFEAHGTPAIALTHVMLVPDGDAWLLVQRQFYVSAGYNAEQAVGAFLPSKAGTVVVYSNRTSTDQVTGFGGGAKRSIGSKLLGSQLESLFERSRKTLDAP